MNLLSDKIAMLYEDLSVEKIDDLHSRWWSEPHIIVNEYAFIDEEHLLCINISPTAFINIREIVFHDIEWGTIEAFLPYREMTEEEFFQNTTVLDFGACDYDDIRFANRHIDHLQTLSVKYASKVEALIQKHQRDLQAIMAREMTLEIDKEIVKNLYGAWENNPLPWVDNYISTGRNHE